MPAVQRSEKWSYSLAIRVDAAHPQEPRSDGTGFTAVGSVPGADLSRIRRFLHPGRFELVAFVLLAATAASAVFTSRGWQTGDLALFAGAGKTMLSGAWAHTFHDPIVQAAPLELLAARLLTLVSWSPASLAAATEVILCGALIATFRTIVGRRALPLILFIVVAIALGPIPDAYSTGHFAEPVAGILWLLAARHARAGRVGRAGLLIGLSSGFELWGVLGVAVLALAPNLRRSVRGAVIAAEVTTIMLAPFVVGGDFHMFAWKWYVAGGPIHLLVGVGYPFGWPLRLLQGVATVGLAGGLALLIRRSPVSIFVIPAATVFVRLLFDPLGLYYYWDPAIEIALLGAAAALVQRGTLVDSVHAALGPRYAGLVTGSRFSLRRKRTRPV